MLLKTKIQPIKALQINKNIIIFTIGRSNKLILTLLLTLGFPSIANAGLDKFSFLEMVGPWRIERKIFSSSNKIHCRASIPRYSTWFGDRIRLDRLDNIIIPKELFNLHKPNKEIVDKVKEVLGKCRSNIIYTPNQQY